MKTKGVNSSKQLDQFKTKDEQAQTEVRMKGMINSCFAYGGMEEDTWNYNRYILPYKEQLPEKVFHEVYSEQCEYLSRCTVSHGVYTNSEGCTYNSIIEL